MTADPLIIGTVTDILSSLATVDVARDAERTGQMPARLWSTLAEGGFLSLGLPEEVDGGGSVEDAAVLLRLAGYYAAPLPIAENGLLGRWLLADAGLPVGNDVLGLAPRVDTDEWTLTQETAGWVLSGAAERVPWGRQADRLVALVEGDEGSFVVSVPLGAAELRHGTNLAGEPRDTIILDAVELQDGQIAAAPDGMTPLRLKARGALARALMMAGALARIQDLCAEHCESRHQFGRPLNRLQAVAQHLALITERSMLTRMAVELAVPSFAHADSSGDAMVAKTIAGDAASDATRRAHQVHGAIGVTEEYALQLFTRRLWTWRDEYGSGRFWSARIGAAAIAAGPGEAWSACVDGLSTAIDETAGTPAV